MRPLWLLALVLVTSLATTPVSRAAPPFDHLNPGGPADLREKVPVQFVFVGYTPAQVDQAAFLAELPKAYKPVVRSRLWYGVTEYLGIHYTFDYKVAYTDTAYQDMFFQALSGLATSAARTDFQDAYNDQKHNVLEVGQNHFIDGPSVEKWLAANPPPGVNTTRNTVVFVNWYGRPDFKFHVYTKFGEPDPDTGYDFGMLRASRKIIAWGGTTPDDEETGLGPLGRNRIWFYDLSAGPEAWTDNWNVDDRDVDGDGVPDYRMPPIWEYLIPGGFRPATQLTGDLGKVARYVAINLLFTPSPLYPPYITPDRQPGSINMDLNTYEGWPGVNASRDYQTPRLLVQEVSEVHPIAYNFDRQDVAFDEKAKRCYRQWLRDEFCYDNRSAFYPGFAGLFVYNALHIRDFWNGGGEYEAMFFNYATENYLAAPFLGYADDNWIDGTQSFTFNFVSAFVVSLGYGLTTTQIHEYGHHFGMSHPHDGYDYERRIDYGPEGRFYYAWSGDELNSMMSYIDLNWDYSQFDRDNAHRFQAAAYIISANAIAEDILKDPDRDKAMADLEMADDGIGMAEEAMAAHNYAAAFNHARMAYRHVRDGAAKAGVVVQASQAGWYVLPPSRILTTPVKPDYAYRDRIAAWPLGSTVGVVPLGTPRGTQRAKP